MNLIEKLGLEKCKQIVDGAPDWATTYCTAYAAYGATFHWYGSCKNCYELPVLRTAIADHGTPTNEGTDNLSHFDHCSDIANHISPLTKVTER